jgi:hypothetical protein
VDLHSTVKTAGGPDEPKPAPEPAPTAKPEPKPEEKPAAEPAPAAKPEEKPAPEPAPAAEPKPAPEPAPVAEPKPAPEPPPVDADALKRDGSRRIVDASKLIMKLMETKLPDDATSLLQLRLEAEDALAGLDDAEFKFSKALGGLRGQPERAEEVRKLEANLGRLRELRQAFLDDFVKRLDRKSGRR